MLKRILVLSALAVCPAFMVGCDKAASVAGSAGSAAKEKGAEALASAKDAVTKNIDLTKVEEKIGTLSVATRKRPRPPSSPASRSCSMN